MRIVLYLSFKHNDLLVNVKSFLSSITAYQIRIHLYTGILPWSKSKRIVAAVNRTRGSCMASTNFTTKPLRRICDHSPAGNLYYLILSDCRPDHDQPTDHNHLFTRLPFTHRPLAIRSSILVFNNTHNPYLTMEPLYLPDLEARTLARFDELATKGKIFYEPAVSELVTVDCFDVS
jgi:hypothetical protein